jgi:thiamine pyrophosphate-dependent acetolactate synthase large subunit-like protein
MGWKEFLKGAPPGYYQPRPTDLRPNPPPRDPNTAVKILKRGIPIILHGECIACHTVVETNTKDARKYQVPIRTTGMPKVHFEVTCPICGTPFEVRWHGPGWKSIEIGDHHAA